MTKQLKFVWRVCPAPTGRYRSFQHRGWPHAEINGNSAIAIQCADSYEGRYSRDMAGKHDPLSVYIACWRKDQPGFDWRRLKGTFSTIKEAKAAGESFLREHPEFLEQNKGKLT